MAPLAVAGRLAALDQAYADGGDRYRIGGRAPKESAILAADVVVIPARWSRRG